MSGPAGFDMMSNMKIKLVAAIVCLSLTAGCGLRQHPALSDYPDDPELWRAAERFYEFLKLKQLDGFYDQPGLREFFPDRDSYYDFLDTILPPMRERRFERNRILDYRVRQIQTELGQARITVSFLSDDLLPFGKVMTVEHRWILGAAGWYPGKVEAPKANLWDKLR